MNTLELRTFDSQDAAIFYARHQKGFELARDRKGTLRLRRSVFGEIQEATVIKAGDEYYLETRKLEQVSRTPADVLRFPSNWM